MYGHYISIDLSADSAGAVLIPAGCAHGFLSLADKTIVVYMQTSVYSQEHDMGILWNSFGMDWGIDNPVLSPRDRTFPTLEAFKTTFD